MTTFDNSCVNNVEIQGECKDIVCRQTSKGNDYITLRLAWEGERDKLWINVIWFGGAKAAAVHKLNPASVTVKGRLVTNSYESKKEPGKKVYEIKIMAFEVNASGTNPEPVRADKVETPSPGYTGPAPDEDIPF